MTMLTAAVVAALAAQTAFAERVNKPFNTTNGRTTTGPAEPPRVITVTKPGGGAGANTAAPDITAPAFATAVNIADGGGGMGIVGGGRRSVSRTSGGSRRSGKTFWGGRNMGAPAPAPAPEEAPPHFSKPGALIRTTGQAPVYEKAEAPRTHTVDAGAIGLSKHKTVDMARSHGLRVGPKDTLPPPNPGTGGGYGTGASANSGPTTDSGGKPKDNNGSGNNDKGKSGDDFDDHGGVSTDLVGDSFNAAF